MKSIVRIVDCGGMCAKLLASYHFGQQTGPGKPLEAVRNGASHSGNSINGREIRLVVQWTGVAHRHQRNGQDPHFLSKWITSTLPTTRLERAERPGFKYHLFARRPRVERAPDTRCVFFGELQPSLAHCIHLPLAPRLPASPIRRVPTESAANDTPVIFWPLKSEARRSIPIAAATPQRLSEPFRRKSNILAPKN